MTISQARFGAQLEDIRLLYNYTNASGSPQPGVSPALEHASAQQTLGFLWTLPADPSSHRGLGGGLTWAWDPTLCDHLQGRFREDFFFVPFIKCEDLRAAMHRGFASWSDNSARIAFHDVTAECDKLSPDGAARKDCPLAELWVTYIGSPTQRGGGAGLGTSLTTVERRAQGEMMTRAESIEGLPDEGEQYVVGGDHLVHRLGGGTSAALAQPQAMYTGDFTFTNGRRPSRSSVIETVGATISFNTGLCWYLDSTFCFYFHSTKQAC